MTRSAWAASIFVASTVFAGMAAADNRTYTDSFDKANSGGWDLGKVATIGKGALTITGGSGPVIVQRYDLFGPLTDVVVGEQYKGGGDPDLAVQAPDGKSIPVAQTGIIAFDLQDTSNFYAVEIDQNGHYKVSVLEKGQERVLVPWTLTKALKTDTDQNLVRIDVQPSLGAREFIVSFNGEDTPLVIDSSPTLPDTGDVAFGALNGVFAFSSLQVDAAPGPSETFSDDFQYSAGGWVGVNGAQVQPKNGQLKLDGTGTLGYALARRESGYDTQPGWIETKVNWESGDGQNGGVGMAFAVTNSDTFYAYLVNPQRSALEVVAFIAGSSHTVLDWTPLKNVFQPGKPVELGVVPVATDDGFDITLYLNGIKVGLVPDDTSRPLVTDYGVVAINAVGTFTGFTAFGPAAPAPLFPLSVHDAVDTFDPGNFLGWDLRQAKIQNHRLVLDGQKATAFTAQQVPLPTVPTEIDEDITWEAGGPDSAPAEMFDIVDGQSFYLFEVAARGLWTVKVYDAKDPKNNGRVVVKPTPDPIIVPRGRNILGVHVTPSSDGTSAQLDFYINGKKVGSATEKSQRFFSQVGFASTQAGVAAVGSQVSVASIRFQGSGIPTQLAKGIPWNGAGAASEPTEESTDNQQDTSDTIR
jgi:hypothetical protein